MLACQNLIDKLLDEIIKQNKKNRERSKIVSRAEAQQIRDEMNRPWKQCLCPKCLEIADMTVYDFLQPLKKAIHPSLEGVIEPHERMRLQCTACGTKHNVYSAEEIPFLSTDITTIILYLGSLMGEEKEEDEEAQALSSSNTVSPETSEEKDIPLLSEKKDASSEEEAPALPLDLGAEVAGPFLNMAAYDGMEPDITYDGMKILVLGNPLPNLALNRSKENPLEAVSISTLCRFKKRFCQDLDSIWDVLASLQRVDRQETPSMKKAVLQILFHHPGDFLKGFFEKTGYPFLSCKRPFLSGRFFYGMVDYAL